MCGPLCWHNVSDSFHWTPVCEGKLPASILLFYEAWPVDGDVNLLWYRSGFDASQHSPSTLLLAVALAEERGVSPCVEGHATNSWPPLRTMKLLIQDAQLVHSAFWLEKGWHAIIMSGECHNLSDCLCEHPVTVKPSRSHLINRKTPLFSLYHWTHCCFTSLFCRLKACTQAHHLVPSALVANQWLTLCTVCISVCL